MPRRLSAVLAVLVAIAVAGTAVASSPPSAPAERGERAADRRVIGETALSFHPDGRCAPMTALQSQTDGAPSYLVPFPGVITRWRVRTARNNRARMRFVLFRSPAPDSYTEVARSAYRQLRPARRYDFSTRIRARKGDLIGFSFQGDLHCQFDVGLIGNQMLFAFGDDPGPGQPFVGQPYEQRHLNLAVVVERDRDGDGYGDVSQDRCPARPNPACERTAPRTRITQRPPARTGARQAAFRFASNEARSRFVCSVDGGPFRSCNSPVYRTVGRGQHVFKVAAIDRWGNRDRSPAVARWRVV